MAKLDKQDHDRIHAAADAVRARTAAQFEVLIVPVSDRYALYPVAFGAFAALIVGGLLAALRPRVPLDEAFGIEAVVFVLVSVLLEWPPLKLLLVPRRQKHERARQFAHRAFAARVLAARERRPGMVLFASLGERAIELVTDDALDRKAGQPAWNTVVADFTATAKSGRIADGLIEAIAACGRELERHYPKV